VTSEEKYMIDKEERAHSDKLERGEPSYYSQILKHLLFKSSNQMIDHLKYRGVSMETQYLGEKKFLKAL
jgi:hypothetical protein